eukprot:g1731.t1
MSGTAEGWFVVSDASSRKVKSYVKLTATKRLILSAERGGDELENICVSGFTEMIHKGTENGYIIELMKHMEEQVPNLCLATSSFETYESMSGGLQAILSRFTKVIDEKTHTCIAKIMRKLKSRLDLNTVHLYEIRRLLHLVDVNLRSSNSEHSMDSKDDKEFAAIKAVETATKAFGQGIQFASINSTKVSVKDQLQQLENLIQFSWNATHDLVLYIGKKEIKDVLQSWERCALESENHSQQKFQAIKKNIETYKALLRKSQRSQKHLALSSLSSKSRRFFFSELKDAVKNLDQNLKDAMSLKKENSKCIAEMQRTMLEMDDMVPRNDANDIDNDLQKTYDEMLIDFHSEMRIVNEEFLLLEQQEIADFALELSERDNSIKKGLPVCPYTDEENEKQFQKWYLNSFNEPFDTEKRKSIIESSSKWYLESDYESDLSDAD